MDEKVRRSVDEEAYILLCPYCGKERRYLRSCPRCQKIQRQNWRGATDIHFLCNLSENEKYTETMDAAEAESGKDIPDSTVETAGKNLYGIVRNFTELLKRKNM